MKAISYFKALSDETRLRLLHIFLHHELNVNEIAAIMGMGQSRISRHLKILADAGLLTSRRDGLWTFYTATSEGKGHDFAESVKFLFDLDPLFGQDLTDVRRVLDEGSREATRFFDDIAEDWDKLKREIIGNVDLNGLIADFIPAGETVVDLGCGTGDLLATLKAKANRVIGVEKSPRMLDEARRQFANDSDKISFRIGELEHLPVREGEADLAVINMVLHHLADPRQAIREVNRVLKKDNTFIIADLLKHDQEKMRERYGDRWLGFSKEEIEKWLESCGFQLERIEYFDLKKNLKGFIIKSVKNGVC